MSSPRDGSRGADATLALLTAAVAVGSAPLAAAEIGELPAGERGPAWLWFAAAALAAAVAGAVVLARRRPGRERRSSGAVVVAGAIGAVVLFRVVGDDARSSAALLGAIGGYSAVLAVGALRHLRSS